MAGDGGKGQTNIRHNLSGHCAHSQYWVKNSPRRHKRFAEVFSIASVPLKIRPRYDASAKDKYDRDLFILA